MRVKSNKYKENCFRPGFPSLLKSQFWSSPDFPFSKPFSFWFISAEGRLLKEFFLAGPLLSRVWNGFRSLKIDIAFNQRSQIFPVFQPWKYFPFPSREFKKYGQRQNQLLRTLVSGDFQGFIAPLSGYMLRVPYSCLSMHELWVNISAWIPHDMDADDVGIFFAKIFPLIFFYSSTLGKMKLRKWDARGTEKIHFFVTLKTDALCLLFPLLR